MPTDDSLVQAEARQAALFLKALLAEGVEIAAAVQLTQFFISSNRITRAAERPKEEWET